MKQYWLIGFLLISCSVYGQSNREKKFNFEVGLNYSFAADKKDAEGMKYKPGFYLEGRYNFSRLPLDIGVQMDYSTFRRVSGSDLPFRSFSITPFADYRFLRGYKVIPYAGCGIGVAFSNVRGVFNRGFHTNLCIAPRVGIRFCRHFNVSLAYRISHSDYSHMSVNAGFYF